MTDARPLLDEVTQFLARSPDSSVTEIARGVVARLYDVRRVLRAGCADGVVAVEQRAANAPKLYRLAPRVTDRPGRSARRSQNDLLAAVLVDGRWHSTAELHKRCGFMRLNSRIAELRSTGHSGRGMMIESRRLPFIANGPEAYEYRFVGWKPGYGLAATSEATARATAAGHARAVASDASADKGSPPESLPSEASDSLGAAA